MWYKNWRNEIWSQINSNWDMIIIGGGITGAGILREATRLGLKTLLIEWRDFSWGTSSRSSKLIHGGLRYLKEGKLRLTRTSVKERELLLQEGPGLIDPLGFLLSVYQGDFPGRWTYLVGLSIYDLLALRWDHKYYSPQDFQLLAPQIAHTGLQGGFRYGDAQTDDARLVLRIIREAVADGGQAINYVKAVNLIRKNGRVNGISLMDQVTGKTTHAYSRVIINATGAWADNLRQQVGATPKIRPLRGSHLIFSAWRLPVAQAVSFLHPLDRRPVFIFPWEGITLVGTTDVDHLQSLDEEPRISPAEVAYLMAAVDSRFPSLEITLDDIVSTYAGVRPVIGRDKSDPSEESRDHVVWQENGLLTVTGGKLTTFRRIALDTIKTVGDKFPELKELIEDVPVLNNVDVHHPILMELDEEKRKRLLGRFGTDAPKLVTTAKSGELDYVPNTETMWAELRWGARAEGVIHLDDLLLRRVRLGMLVPQGASEYMRKIRSICQDELGWDDEKWSREESAYLELWKSAYSLPETDKIPNWKPLLAAVQRERQLAIPIRNRRMKAASLLAGLFSIISILLIWILWSKRRRIPSKLTKQHPNHVSMGAVVN